MTPSLPLAASVSNDEESLRIPRVNQNASAPASTPVSAPVSAPTERLADRSGENVITAPATADLYAPAVPIHPESPKRFSLETGSHDRSERLVESPPLSVASNCEAGSLTGDDAKAVPGDGLVGLQLHTDVNQGVVSSALSVPFSDGEASDAYDSDTDDSHSFCNTPFQIASTVKKRRLHSRFIDPNCPSEDMIYDSGTILIKIKRWPFRHTFQEHYWIKYGRHSLYFFLSKRDADQWIHNKSLTKEERQKLVKLYIDFERDSVSEHIIGYKSTCTYYRNYRQFGELHVSKLYQWKSPGTVAVGTFISNKTATFASKSVEDGEKLHNIIMAMIRLNPTNLRLQHRMLSSSNSYSLMNKIESFDSIEYHDDFADWLLQSKLEESGFIVTVPVLTMTKQGTTSSADIQDTHWYNY